jgi:hypothetical protein
MAKLSTGIREAISRRLRLLYDGIADQGIPDRLAVILTAPDDDPTALPAESAAAA